jgi:energy-coupling factor transport system ATP-binding protein
MDNVIEVKEFCWRYPNFIGKKNKYSLKGINLNVMKGEILGIIGQNEAGKTTLCSSIAGLIPYQMHLIPEEGATYLTGSIKILGRIISMIVDEGAKQVLVCDGVAAPDVGFVMQDPESQFLTATIRQELSLGMRFLGLTEEVIDERIKKALDVVGMSELYGQMDDLHPSQLSGGQKQRLIIACFVALEPKILILDETTSDLDPVGKLQVIDSIKRIKAAGDMTIIIVEQNPEIITRNVDRVALLHSGKLIAVRKPLELYCDERIVRKFLVRRPDYLELSMALGVKPTTSIIQLSKAFEKKMKRSVTEHHRENVSRPKVIISAKQLNFRYDRDVRVLRDIDLDIRSGEFVALIGQNGSGKSTLAKVLSGMEKGYDGAVKIFDLDLSKEKDRGKVPSRVGYVFQNPDQQIISRRVYDEVSYGITKGKKDAIQVEYETKRILKSVGLLHKIDEDPFFLDRGQKRRLGLACVLAMNPEVMIIDEPITGQDYKSTIQIMNILKDLNQKRKKTILLITHDMHIVSDYCSRSIVLKGGEKIYDGSTKSLFENDDIIESASLIVPDYIKLAKRLKRMEVIDEIVTKKKTLFSMLE